MFYKLGFTSMNRDRNFKLLFDVYSKQIDIFAVDENNIFIVECGHRIDFIFVGNID